MIPPNYPFPTVATTGDKVEELLLRMRAESSSQTTLPVVVGDYDDAKRLFDVWDHNALDLEEATRQAIAIDPKEWLQHRRDEEPDAYTLLDEDDADPKEAQSMTRLAIGYTHTGKPRKEVFIAQVPTANYWTLPLHLRFGDWNECPDPIAHTMMALYWEQKYGARIAVSASDTIEFTVERPPTSAQQCEELAREQYIYCADIVEQGVGSVASLAQSLRDSQRWFFWWD